MSRKGKGFIQICINFPPVSSSFYLYKIYRQTKNKKQNKTKNKHTKNTQKPQSLLFSYLNLKKCIKKKKYEQCLSVSRRRGRVLPKMLFFLSHSYGIRIFQGGWEQCLFLVVTCTLPTILYFWQHSTIDILF